MRRLFTYIGLSAGLHVFAVWPLLAQQFAVANDVTAEVAAVSGHSVLAVPTLVMKAAAPAAETQVSEPQTAEPAQLETAAHQEALEPQPLLVERSTVAPAKLKQEQNQAQSTLEVTPPRAIERSAVPKPEAKKEEAAELRHTPKGKPETERKEEVAQAKTATEQALQIAALAPVTDVQASRDVVQTESQLAEVISTQPRFARPPASPNYPAKAKRRQQQGTAWVEVRLSARGQVLALHILRTSGVSSLDQAAIAAVRKWHFLPETRNGVGVPSRVHIPIEFAIKAPR